MTLLPETDSVSLERRVFELETELGNQQMQLNDVATMGLLITSLLDIEKVLSAMMEMATRMVDGEVGCIMLLEKGNLQSKISWGLDEQVVKSIKINNDLDIARHTLETGTTTLLNGFKQKVPGGASISSILAVPLSSRDKKIGVLIVVNKASGGPFSDHDREMIEMLVMFAAVAIENANLLSEMLQNQKLEQELCLAREVQRALLPEKNETFQKAVIEASYVPAGHVGGDYYDVIPLSEEEFVVIVGDVSNKGVPAALMMTAARSVFRREANKSREIDKVLTSLNSFLCNQVLKSDNMFISLVYAYFNLKELTCQYVNAGHIPPLHYRALDNTIGLWKTGGTFLGQFPDFEYRSELIQLHPGDKVLIYTDGISEAESPSGILFGRPRVETFFKENARLSALEISTKLLRDIERYRGGAEIPQSDDITTLLVELR